LKCGVDFKIGYSPERINPGDKVHRLETIVLATIHILRLSLVVKARKLAEMTPAPVAAGRNIKSVV
jgi:UDP-N-acetyl-D-galactosamine dehydrogenase